MSNVLLAGCILNIKPVVEVVGDDRQQLPIRSLSVTMDPGQRGELFETFGTFAEARGFEIQISDYGSNGEIFQIWMLRDNIKIIANDIPKSPGLVRIKFYAQNRAVPFPQETLETINELTMDLEDSLRDIPNVTIADE